jgi:hypothetical protein
MWSAASGAQSAGLEPNWLGTSSGSPKVDGTDDAASRKPDRRTDHVRVGALLGVGAPRPLSIEGLVKLERTLAFGLEYSALPSITVSDVRLSCWAIAGSARVFPLKGPFFVGLRGGRQHLDAATTVSAYGYSAPVTLGVDTTFLNPQIGLLWTWEPGFSVGIDAGVQIPLSSSTSSSIDAKLPALAQPAASSAQSDAEGVARTVGQTVLPTIDLVRIGMLF